MVKPKTKLKSVPMRYYNSAFIKKAEYVKLKQLKKKYAFKSMSDLLSAMRIVYTKFQKAKRKNIK